MCASSTHRFRLQFITPDVVFSSGIFMALGAKANIRLKFHSEKQVNTLLEALTPETKATVTKRASVELEKDGLFLVLWIDADDTVALRSTLNAYLRWINSAINIIGLIEHKT